MPQGRIIYIKNPSEGSNFRNLGGSRSPKKPGKGHVNKGPAPRRVPVSQRPAPVASGSTYTGTGGAIYAAAASNWFQAQPSPANYGANLSQIIGGVGPYSPPVLDAFHPAASVWGYLYLVSQGVDPITGEVSGLGVPGTLKFGVGTPLGWITQEQSDAGNIPGDPTVYGWTTGGGRTNTPANLYPKIPSGYLTLAPNRNNKRPWWAK